MLLLGIWVHFFPSLPQLVPLDSMKSFLRVLVELGKVSSHFQPMHMCFAMDPLLDRLQRKCKCTLVCVGNMELETV